ncbi:hypothetical protein LA5095_00573 [Roseibium album]|uniref:Uncharacterized protein n=1 Tax=Roseibium album TaxID=311410 RepID=A0A0M6ZEF6_9HYPH|nr:hypothetical protein [Labrenzia sp. EL_142]MBG6198902.1 hypothetical protein [Labrenzia sp. EL_13]CTQ60621.1 hypothetical protein LA5094_03397 [Roseibium album]CTQ65502.1 hypothetical protein LA5095_00573 [Roseibium album]CTQ73575.1 hypothetical protein LA5096_03713 [Roseibium album]
MSDVGIPDCAPDAEIRTVRLVSGKSVFGNIALVDVVGFDHRDRITL